MDLNENFKYMLATKSFLQTDILIKMCKQLEAKQRNIQVDDSQKVILLECDQLLQKLMFKTNYYLSL